MRSQIAKRRGVDAVEVVQNAGLMRAEKALTLRIAHVPAVTREVDARIGIEERSDVVAQWGHARTIMKIVCFVKAN